MRQPLKWSWPSSHAQERDQVRDSDEELLLGNASLSQVPGAESPVDSHTRSQDSDQVNPSPEI